MLPYENVMVGITTVLSLVEALAYLGARDENDKPFYRLAGTWCWLGNDRNRLVVYYVLAWIILILSWITFVLAQVALQKKADNISNDSERGVSPAIARTIEELNLGTAEGMRGHIRKLCLYFVAYIVPVVISSINRLQNMASPGNTIFGLYVLTSFFGQLHGIVIACVFFTSENHKARQRVKQRRNGFRIST
ncbi:hypothetical protein M427DRAFT_70252 [Gonapodya prolifera JEL478]|uniref:G-protein coupled receptors family 2 profile 2 domain-containing protein n=1 Tax=Gonapodya prolifera (strain JEL478) TaxID=1344416 RepID=A0A139ADR0_GONPJ|nr:hypothetical protein M427DRAFT_70252 [Gonapodya prolifera JEL478]|eukprot:KXS14907.1 hypothetical protein M427DRAFT_70252 [Gonapodya prolifera JEL478]